MLGLALGLDVAPDLHPLIARDRFQDAWVALLTELSRSDLRELGLERRAVEAVFRALDVVVLPGYARPMVRACDFHRLLDACTYRDGARVR